jgi:Carboxypeptidase regulatory-like domain
VERVRKTFIVASCLLLTGLVAAESVEVTELKQQPSSRRVQVTVSLNGRRTVGAKVDFCTAGDRPCISVFTDKEGIAASPRLRDGNYIVTASLDDLSGGNLYLHVSRKGRERAFSIDLTESFRAAQNYLAAADKQPIRETLQVFQGLVRDPSEATISGVDIKIVRRGSENHATVQSAKTDPSGHFSAPLDDGVYVAFFSCPGFRTEIVPFEIAARGDKELLVKLQIGQTAESIRVAVKQ